MPEKLLNEGEIVILALKPSLWFIFLVSWPATALVASLVAVAYIGEHSLGLHIPPHLVMVVCTCLLVIQLLAACMQWVGRLYVLTNVRILRVRGVLRVDIFQCPLKQVHDVLLTATTGERFLTVGSLHFKTDCPAEEAGWMHISKPNEVCEVVKDALRRVPR